MLGYLEIIFNKSPRKGIIFFGELGTSTKCRIFSKLMTYLTKAKHRLFPLTILTNLIVRNFKDCKHRRLQFLILNFFGSNMSRDLICIRHLLINWLFMFV